MMPKLRDTTRFPEDNTSVLVYIKPDYQSVGDPFWIEAYHTGEGYFNIEHLKDLMYTITDFQPLPSPPKDTEITEPEMFRGTMDQLNSLRVLTKDITNE